MKEQVRRETQQKLAAGSVKFDWTAGLPNEIKKVILSKGIKKQFEANHEIYTVGEQAKSTYQIIEGEIRIYTYDNTHKHKQVLITSMGKGACFGLFGLLDNLPLGNSAITTCRTQLLVISKADFHWLYSNYSEISYNINRLLASYIRILISRLNENMVLNLRQRVARHLYRFAVQYGELSDNQMSLPNITHDDIAIALGSSRQSIGREMRELQKDGFIDQRYKVIQIPDFNFFKETFYNLLFEDVD